jgi:tetratricopeptide (TPR) repeat protein
LFAIAVVVVAMALTGIATDPLAGPAWRELRDRQPALDLGAIEGGLGQGLTLGLLGGFRSIIADFLWLETNNPWEDMNLPATQTLIKLVVGVDPRPLYFWLNGARMIAYDMPVWRIDAMGGINVVPASVQRRINEEQAAIAFDILDRALLHHQGHDAALIYVDIANIHLLRLGDKATAAEYFRKAAEQPGAPNYAARIYGELLRGLGRNREAYEWLRQTYAKLPAHDDPNNPALRGIVLGRIRALEHQLGIPSDQRVRDDSVRPQSGPP